jgi:hypothetical protein
VIRHRKVVDMQTTSTIQSADSPVAECIPEAVSFAGRPDRATTALAALLLWGDVVTAAERLRSPARRLVGEGRVNLAGLCRGTPARQTRVRSGGDGYAG